MKRNDGRMGVQDVAGYGWWLGMAMVVRTKGHVEGLPRPAVVEGKNNARVAYKPYLVIAFGRLVARKGVCL